MNADSYRSTSSPGMHVTGGTKPPMSNYTDKNPCSFLTIWLGKTTILKCVLGRRDKIENISYLYGFPQGLKSKILNFKFKALKQGGQPWWLRASVLHVSLPHYTMGCKSNSCFWPFPYLLPFPQQLISHRYIKLFYLAYIITDFHMASWSIMLWTSTVFIY